MTRIGEDKKAMEKEFARETVSGCDEQGGAAGLASRRAAGSRRRIGQQALEGRPPHGAGTRAGQT
jgi:hypothetical protein